MLKKRKFDESLSWEFWSHFDQYGLAVPRGHLSNAVTELGPGVSGVGDLVLQLSNIVRLCVTKVHMKYFKIILYPTDTPVVLR